MTASTLFDKVLFMNPSATSPREAIDTLRHLEDLSGQTRALLRSFWFPLVLFGVLTLLSAPVALVGEGVEVAVYWAVAGTAGGAAVGWYYHHREERLGLSRSGVPYIATGVALLVAAFALPAMTSGRLQEVVSAFAVAGAYLIFAWLDRSAVLAVLSAALVVVPAVALASSLEHPGPVVAVVTGLAILVTGIVARRAEQQGR